MMFGWNFVKLFNKNCASCLQAFYDIAIMHDFVAHIDRRSIFFQSENDYLYCSVDTGTKAARSAEANC